MITEYGSVSKPWGQRITGASQTTTLLSVAASCGETDKNHTSQTEQPVSPTAAMVHWLEEAPGAQIFSPCPGCFGSVWHLNQYTKQSSFPLQCRGNSSTQVKLKTEQEIQPSSKLKEKSLCLMSFKWEHWHFPAFRIKPKYQLLLSLKSVHWSLYL